MDEQRGSMIGWFVGGAVLLVLIFIILPWASGFRTVDAGEVGVVTNFGRVTGRTLQPGASFVQPFIENVLTYNTKLVTYETAKEESQKSSQADYKDFPVDTSTSDGQPVDISYTIRFAVDPTKAVDVAQKIGPESALVEKIVKTESRIWVRNIPRNYTAEQLYSGKSLIEAQDQIRARLEPTFKKNGLVLDTVGIREVKFDDNYVAAIKQKQIEQVKIATETNKASQAIQIKNQRITNAEAAAKEQELQRTTLSPEYLQKLALDVQLKQLDVLEHRWNGAYPQYLIVSENLGTSLLPLPNVANK